MSGVAGYGGWRWIFIVEGLITVVIGVISAWFVCDWPETCKFLSKNERRLLQQRLALEQRDANMDTWNKKTAKRVFGDIKIYLGILMYIGIVTTSYSAAFFNPTILRQLSWTSLRAQVMTIPVYAAALCGALACAWASDKLKHRFAFVLLGCATCTLGYAILLSMHRVPLGARYFGIYALTCGPAIAQPAAIVWVNNNMSGHYKKGVSSAMMIGIGNIAGIIASNIYLSSQAPEYPLGFGLGLSLVWVAVITAVVFLGYIMHENKLRDEGKRDDRYELPEEERKNLGDDHPAFRFTY